MKQLKLETNIAFGQRGDSLDLTSELPTALTMIATFLQEALLDRYNLSIACQAGQDRDEGLFFIKLYEDGGKLLEIDKELNKLWCDLAETANCLQKLAREEYVIDFDIEKGIITAVAAEFYLDLLVVISDREDWGWCDPKICFDRGYSYCLRDIAQIASLSAPHDPKNGPAFRYQ